MSFIKKTLSAAKNLKAKSIVFSLIGSAILAFGLYNVHSISSVTEGGVLGLTLYVIFSDGKRSVRNLSYTPSYRVQDSLFSIRFSSCFRRFIPDLPIIRFSPQ